jgi:hypothetical protein
LTPGAGDDGVEIVLAGAFHRFGQAVGPHHAIAERLQQMGGCVGGLA